MTDDELLDLLKTEGDLLTLDDVSAILDRGAALAPALEELLEDETLWKSHGAEGWAVVHAFFLLGGIRAPGSLAPLIRALGRAYEHEVDEIGEVGPLLLSGFGPGALTELQAAAGDRKLPLQVRLDVLIALGWTARRHPQTAGAVPDALRRFAEGPGGELEFRRMAASVLLDFARPADRAFLSSADFFEAETVEAVYRDGPEPMPAPDEWLRFYEPQEDDGDPSEPGEEGPDIDLEALAAQRDLLAPLDSRVPAEGPLRADAKVGRNDPCPCGSGKKHKKCCGG